MERGRTIKAAGAEIFACSEGAGTPLLLTHGLGDDHSFWDPCVEMLARYHTVIRWDVRGYGKSSKPPGPYDLPMLAGDLRAVMDALDIDKAHLVGLSMGGVITQQFLVDEPGRVLSATLASTSSEISERATANWRRLADRVESRGFGKVDASRSFAPDFAARNPAIVVAAEKQTLSNDPAGYAAGARAVSEYDLTDDLRQLRLPVLVLQGLEDQLTPPGGSVRMSRAIAGSRLLLMPGVGHSLAVETPEWFVATVVAFTGALDWQRENG